MSRSERSIDRVLIANRGEVAVRLLRGVRASGAAGVVAHSQDDSDTLAVRYAAETVALPGTGPAAYLDREAIVAAAVDTGCDAVHPGYGFLSEDPVLARACAAAGVVFVGPTAQTLELFGHKARARGLARDLGVPVLPGSGAAVGLSEAMRFLDELGGGSSMVVKAVAGGGGRGMRVVANPDELTTAWDRCRSEAKAAFGNEELMVEAFAARARHVEVQIIGDGSAAVTHLGERECSLQRRHQKVIEVAPAPNLDGTTREALHAAAVTMASHVSYEGLGTFEFLVLPGPGQKGGGQPASPRAGSPQAANPREASAPEASVRQASAGQARAEEAGFVFLEVNPRLQVEHTVTEEVTGIDLVRTSIELARGASLADLGLDQDHAPVRRGVAIEARVNTETVNGDGTVVPSPGRLEVFQPPTGPGVRVDTHAHAGHEVGPRYDSLLAKVIASGPTLGDAMTRLDTALAETRVSGVRTNIGFLRAIVNHPDVRAGEVTTDFIDTHAADLAADQSRALRPTGDSAPGDSAPGGAAPGGAGLGGAGPGGPSPGGPKPATNADAPHDVREGVVAPLQGIVVEVLVTTGEAIAVGTPVVVLEAMKMEHVLDSPYGGIVGAVPATVGANVDEGTLLVHIDPAEVDGAEARAEELADPDEIRPDLAEVLERKLRAGDEARAEAVDKRHAKDKRTASENVEDLCDEGTFREYGGLVVAAQRSTRPFDELVDRTPRDGIITGLGRVDGEPVVVLAYDYTVLAGTQGFWGHRKQDRMLEIAHETRSPVVIFTEGGGGRPSDTDLGSVVVSALDTSTWGHLGKLSGRVPTVGITSGYCFAGNAVLLGMCDVVIATRDSNIGIGGPAMIAGAGMGDPRPSEIGPHDDQVASGVIDISVADEAEAVAVAKKFLSYVRPLDLRPQGREARGEEPQHEESEWVEPEREGASREEARRGDRGWSCADQRLLRSVVPENRVRAYDIRRLIELLADDDSVLELRSGFGATMVTALARIDGRAVGVIANNPLHLAGAIDSDGADKAARFMQLCDAYGLPILSLCDTPGIMVGAEAERTGLVRHASRMFTIGANITVPFVTVVVRKGYGLGAQAMAAGHFRAPLAIVSWPTGEFGGMGLEGAIRLAFAKELAGIDDDAEREERFRELVDALYARSKALGVASVWEIDDVIDPADTRSWLSSVLDAAVAAGGRSESRYIDNW